MFRRCVWYIIIFCVYISQLWKGCGWQNGVCVGAVKFFDGIFDKLDLPRLTRGADVDVLKDGVVAQMKQCRALIQPKLQEEIDVGDGLGHGQSDSMLDIIFDIITRSISDEHYCLLCYLIQIRLKSASLMIGLMIMAMVEYCWQ